MSTKPPTSILHFGSPEKSEGGAYSKPGTGIIPPPGSRPPTGMVAISPPSTKAKANEKFKNKEPLFILCLVAMGGALLLNLILTFILFFKSPPTIPEEDISTVNAPVLAQIEQLRVEMEKIRNTNHMREAELTRLRQQVGGVESQMGMLATQRMENVPIHPDRKD